MYCLLRTEGRTIVNLENGVQLLLTLNEHNCFFNMLEAFFTKSRKDRFYFILLHDRFIINYFLLNVYFVKIKNEHGNAHFNNFLFLIFQITLCAHSIN